VNTIAHLTLTDSLTALGALALGLLAKYIGLDGDYFAVVAAVVGVALGVGLSRPQS